MARKVTIIRICFVLITTIISILWFRFVSWDFLVPWYQTKINLPLAPLIASIFLISWILFDKNKVSSSIRKNIQSLIDSNQRLVILVLVTFLMTSIILLEKLTPPKWSYLIDDIILDGYDDDFARAEQLMSFIESKDPELALLIDVSIKLEKSKKESSNWVDNVYFYELNSIQRKLNTIATHSNYSRNLKLYTVAVLNYTLLGLDQIVDEKIVVERIHDVLDKLISSKSKFITPELVHIAKRMKYNTFYFTGEVKKAVSGWENMQLRPNILANLVAGYRDQGLLDKSLAAGLKGIELIKLGMGEDSQSLNALVANTMTTYMHLGDLEGAKELYHELYVLEGMTSDNALLQQYAIFNILTGDMEVVYSLIGQNHLQNDELEYVELLLALYEKNINKSIELAKKITNDSKRDLSGDEVWNYISEQFDHAGYLDYPRLAELINWARQNHGPKELRNDQ